MVFLLRRDYDERIQEIFNACLRNMRFYLYYYESFGLVQPVYGFLWTCILDAGYHICRYFAAVCHKDELKY